MGGRSQQVLPWIAGGVIAAVLVAWLLPSSNQPAETTASAPPSLEQPARAALPPPLAGHAGRPLLPAGEDLAEQPDRGLPGSQDSDSDGEDMYDPSAEAWSNVDLDAVRRKMPDNLYFELSAPTKDEAVLERRAAERQRWNVEYGKMLSGTGTEEEIRAYYDQRARLSGDYVEFTTYLLDNHRAELPERDVAMIELARRMHLARLEEIPRQVQEARERKRKQDEARAAWLADEAEFGRQ
jgi:hypothetical protein